MERQNTQRQRPETHRKQRKAALEIRQRHFPHVLARLGRMTKDGIGAKPPEVDTDRPLAAMFPEVTDPAAVRQQDIANATVAAEVQRDAEAMRKDESPEVDGVAAITGGGGSVNSRYLVRDIRYSFPPDHPEYPTEPSEPVQGTEISGIASALWRIATSSR